MAVFSFAVNRKQSHYQVNYCCFPKTENVGTHIGMTPMGVGLGGGKAPTSENLGTATSFEPFKTRRSDIMARFSLILKQEPSCA